MRCLVADTGPVLHLEEAQSVALLALVGEVHVPPAVATEMQHYLPVWRHWRPPWLQIVSLQVAYHEEAATWY